LDHRVHLELVDQGAPVLSRTANRPAGFTILEMMMTIAVFSILVALGVPSMKTWIYNNRVRAVADSLQNGLRLAQAESLRRSRQVVFSFTNSTAPQTASLTAAAGGIYWSINVIPFLSGDTAVAADFVQSGVLGGTTTSASTTPVQIVGGPAEICFNSLGRLVLNTNTGVPGGNCSTLPTTPPLSGGGPVFTYNISLPGSDHPLNVEVGLGGQVRMCDPNVLLTTSSQGC
jgi:type IV fimbrial biogenesis protein FimT